jgi:ceramide glucosyltransferase
LLPKDYAARVLAAWKRDSGLVCAPPIGARPKGFWAEVECGFLNTYQARWQYSAETVGLGFAQGKTMLWRRDDLDSWGGIAALAKELAEDAASTKLVRAAGLKVHLAAPPFEQPLGRRTYAQMIGRQERWAQLRRLSFPLFFAPEIFTGVFPVLLAGSIAMALAGEAPTALLLIIPSIWIGSEALLAWAVGWHLSWRSPIAWLVRDALIPMIWLKAWLARGYEWRGNAIGVVRDGDDLSVAGGAAARS